MAKKLNVMVMGGHTTGFHEFAEMAPVYKTFLTKAGFALKITEDRDDFLSDRLAEFDVVVDYTTGGELTDDQAKGLLGFVKSGRGFVGVHSAADSYHNVRAYERMVGGIFLGHPPTIPHTFKVTRKTHPIMKGVAASFRMPEELYLMDYIGQFETLLTCRFNDLTLPIAWVKPYGCGRVFFTALGHGKEQHENRNFQKMVVNGIRWTAKAKDVREKCRKIGGW